MTKQLNSEAFSRLIDQARGGEVRPLHRYLQQLYRDGRQSLLRLAGSEGEAEEYFAAAVAKFWDKFVVGEAALPDTNVSGYIYTIAKFICLDQKRRAEQQAAHQTIDQDISGRPDLAVPPAAENERAEREAREQRQREAMKRAMKKLSDNCRRLFETILETGVEKSRELYGLLGLDNARTVTVLRYECTKQLKVKAAVELELLNREENQS